MIIFLSLCWIHLQVIVDIGRSHRRSAGKAHWQKPKVVVLALSDVASEKDVFVAHVGVEAVGVTVARNLKKVFTLVS